MPRTCLVFGSSQDLLQPFWRVWSFDDQDGSVIPLAHFDTKVRSDTAAFELAHAAGRFEDPAAMDAILAAKTSLPTPLPPKLVTLFTTLAQKAIATSEAPEPGKTTVTVNTTPDDRVHVVRFYRPPETPPGISPAPVA
jgi:hypothetical protein